MKTKKILPLIKSDPWLEPYKDAIQGRFDYFLDTEKKLTGGDKELSDFATGYLFFGLHHVPEGWIFREWAPNATAIYLVGEFSDWNKSETYRLKAQIDGVWEIQLPQEALKHTQLYKLWIEWEGGAGERIPAWCKRGVQDDHTKIFSAQVWNP